MGRIADTVDRRRLRAWPASKLHDAKLESDVVNALIEARGQMGLSRAGVARRLNLSRATLFYWEQGITFPDRLSKLVEWGRVVGRKITLRIEP